MWNVEGVIVLLLLLLLLLLWFLLPQACSSWYFYSETNGVPHRSGKFQTAVIIIIIIIIIIRSFYSLWSTGHSWRPSRHCGLQLSHWPRSIIFFCFLSHPLLSFARFSSTCLSFYTPADSNLMQLSQLLLFLYVMCVQSSSIFFLFSLLHRACCRVTQLLHQPLHIYVQWLQWLV